MTSEIRKNHSLRISDDMYLQRKHSLHWHFCQVLDKIVFWRKHSGGRFSLVDIDSGDGFVVTVGQSWLFSTMINISLLRYNGSGWSRCCQVAPGLRRLEDSKTISALVQVSIARQSADGVVGPTARWPRRLIGGATVRQGAVLLVWRRLRALNILCVSRATCLLADVAYDDTIRTGAVLQSDVSL